MKFENGGKEIVESHQLANFHFLTAIFNFISNYLSNNFLRMCLAPLVNKYSQRRPALSWAVS